MEGGGCWSAVCARFGERARWVDGDVLGLSLLSAGEEVSRFVADCWGVLMKAAEELGWEVSLGYDEPSRFGRED